MKKRIISIALILIVLVLGGLLAGKALTGKQVNVSWYNDEETEFIIETVDQLYELVELSEKKDLTGKTFKLGADIVVNEGNANDWSENAPARKWYPIKNFSGTFDGQGHTISGLYANIYDKAMGLFVETQKGAVIRDFRLVNTYFKIVGSPGSAAIAGGVQNIGTFEKIYTDAIIDCDGNLTGGIASSINGESTISECWFDGKIIRYYYNHTGGGIVAQVNTTTLKMEHCLNSGSIVADKAKDWIRIGGLCGLIAGKGSLHATDSLVTGTIESITTKQVGSTVGFVGSSSTGVFDTVFATTETYGVSVGNGEDRIQGGAIRLDAKNITGYNGYSWTNLDFDRYWAVDIDGTPILKYFAEEEVSLEGVAKNYNTDWYTGKDSEYTIHSREEFYGLSLLAASKDFTGVTVKLGSDITINEGDAKKWSKEAPSNFWIPIMNWTGIFDGQGHTISGLYMDGKGTMGLFYKTVMDSVVKNFRLTNSYFNNSSTSTAYTGSIAGIGGGEFNTIYSDAIMTSTGVGVGGIVGSASVGMPKIINCWFDGNISLKGEKAHTAAGMAASVTISTSIEHCLNTADISANRTEAYNRLGGMAGVIGTSSTLTVKDSLNTGKITAGEVVKGKTAQAGSIIGFIGSSSGAVLDTVCMTLDSFNVAVGQNEDRCAGMPIQYEREDLLGIKGYQWTNLDFTNYWAAVKNKTPELKSFATSKISTKGVARKFDISWYKADKKSFTISDAADLYGVAMLTSAGESFKGKTIRIEKDIIVNAGDASTWATTAPEDSWIPIANFLGTFDGQGHTISGLYKNGGTNIALFANAKEETVIKNVAVENSYFANKTSTGNVYIAGIVAQGGGTIDTVYSDIIIETTGVGAGGILACANVKGAKVKNAWFAGEIHMLGADAFSAAGITAIVQQDISLETCLFSGDITAERTGKYTRVGGLLGVVGNKSTTNMKDSLSVGTIKSYKQQAGSVIGFLAAKVVLGDDVYVTNESFSTQIGQKSASADLQGELNKVSISSLKGEKAKANASKLNFEKYWMTLSKRTPILKSFESKAPVLVQRGMTPDTSWYNSTDKIFVITTPEQLYGLADLSYDTNFDGITIQLGADITVNTGNASEWKDVAPKYVWEPIQPFAGIFDGQGYTISGLYNADGQNVGLFSETLNQSVIKNIRIKNTYFANMQATGEINIGSIVGQGTGTFDTIYSNAILESTGQGVGGFVGKIVHIGFAEETVEAKFNNCWFDGKVILDGQEAYSGGGLAGIINADTTITDCLNSGEISNSRTKDYNRLGSLAGVLGNKSTTTVKNFLNVGTVTVGKVVEGKNHQAGSVAGFLVSGSTLNIDGVYTTSESNKVAIGQNRGKLNGSISKNDIDKYLGKGAFSIANTMDYKNVWAALEGKTPILRSFLGGTVALEPSTYDTSWYDETATNFTITSAEQLYAMAELAKENGYTFQGQTFELGNDIEVNKLPEGKTAVYWKDANNAPDNVWTPIGTSDAPFAGTFDGKNFAISGLYKDGGTNIGFFGYTATSAIVKNLYLTDTYFRGTAYVGGIASQGGGTFNTIFTDAYLETTGQYSGGIIALVDEPYTEGAHVSNCWFAGTIDNTKAKYSDTGAEAGGIVGRVRAVPMTIEHCLVSGTIKSTISDKNLRIGGLCGTVVTNPVKLTLSDNLVIAEFDLKKTSQAGLVVGFLTGSGAEIQYADDVYVLKSGSLKEIGTSNTGTVVTDSDKYLHVVESIDLLKDQAAYTNAEGLFEVNTWWMAVENDTPVLRSFKGERVEVEKSEEPVTPPTPPQEPESWYNTQDAEFTLTTVEQLYELAELSKDYTFEGQTFYLGADITVNTLPEGQTVTYWKDATNAPEKIWTPIGTAEKPFAGTFDGKGFTIRGLYYSSTTATNIGLFGYTAKTAAIKDLRLLDTYFKAEQIVGSISAQGGGRFEKIYTDAYLETTKQYSGGIIAYVDNTYADSATVTNCWFAGTIDNTKAKYADSTGAEAGGIVGRMKSGATMTVEHCFVTGTIKSAISDTNVRVGGICGCISTAGTTLIITDSVVLANIDVKKTTQVGMVIGFHTSADIEYTDDVYVLKSESDKLVGQKKNGTVTGAESYLHDVTDTSELYGNGTSLNATFWQTFNDKTPVLKSFYEEPQTEQTALMRFLSNAVAVVANLFD